MTLSIAIAMGTTLVLCVVGWKLGDVFRDWMAVRRLDVETRLVRVENVASVAAESAERSQFVANGVEGMIDQVNHIGKQVREHENEIEKLRIRSMRG